MTATIAILLALVLLAIAALHAYWGLGGLWPAASEPELIRTVIGDPRLKRMPSPRLSLIVAGALVAAATWPLVIVALPMMAWSRPLVLVVGLTIGLVFLLRGVAGYLPGWRRSHPLEPFAGNDRRFYSPLCLLVAAGYATLLLQGR